MIVSLWTEIVACECSLIVIIHTNKIEFVYVSVDTTLFGNVLP